MSGVDAIWVAAGVAGLVAVAAPGRPRGRMALARRAAGRGGGGTVPAPLPRLDRAIACELLGVLLAAGLSVPEAMATYGEAAGEKELVVAARMLRWGASWEEATARIPAGLAGLVGPLRAAWVSGVDPGPALRTTAAAWRARRAARAREAAERLAVRLVLPLGLCLLPAFVLLGLLPVALAAAGALLGTGAGLE